MKKSILVVLVLLATTTLMAKADNNDIKWLGYSESVFKLANKEGKFIILDLEAVWCHWCHVMHKKTYSDPEVIKILKSHYIPVRVDQDSRPDLSNRYRDYGWPATIIFNSKGEELVKRAGYIAPEDMKTLLQKIIDDPTPELPEPDPSRIQFSSTPALSNELKELLKENHYTSYDEELGGLNIYQKYLDADSVEYDLLLASLGNKINEKMAKKTLDAAIGLIDPAWGGAYQYSTMGGWNYPHFEKLLKMQARFMKTYANGYSLWKDPKYLKAAKDIHRYLKSFLTSKDGVFYVSQDADVVAGKHSLDYFKKNDPERRKIGIPRVDKHIYSNENGLIIEALVTLHNVTRDKTYLDEAIQAANWIVKHRTLPFSFTDNLNWVFSDWTSPETIFQNIGWIISNKTFPVIGFKHDVKDEAGPFLNDSLNMGRAFISLYNTTNDKKWLVCAEQALRFIDKHFTSPVCGFATSEASCKVCAVRDPSRLVDENISVVRFSNSLYQLTKNNDYKIIAKHAMRYIATPEIVTTTITEPGVLIADLELNNKRSKLSKN